MNTHLSHALKNTASKKPRKLLHILQHATGRIPEKFPGIRQGLQVLLLNACQCAAPSFILVSLDFTNVKPIVV